jgi:hypothetical protein
VEPRRIALQIETIRVTFRIEERRRDSPTMHHFRTRAGELLAELDEAVKPYPELQTQLTQAREELGGDEG